MPKTFLGVARLLPRAGMGVAEATPKGQKNNNNKNKKWVLSFGGGRTTSLAMGVVCQTGFGSGCSHPQFYFFIYFFKI